MKKTKPDIIKDLSYRTGLSEVKSKKFMEDFIELIRDYLINGDEVPLRELGTFSISITNETKRYNGFKDEWVTSPPHEKVKFKVSHVLRDEVRGR